METHSCRHYSEDFFNDGIIICWKIFRPHSLDETVNFDDRETWAVAGRSSGAHGDADQHGVRALGFPATRLVDSAKGGGVLQSAVVSQRRWSDGWRPVDRRGGWRWRDVVRGNYAVSAADIDSRPRFGRRGSIDMPLSQWW